MDGGACWAKVHRVAKSCIPLKQFSTQGRIKEKRKKKKKKKEDGRDHSPFSGVKMLTVGKMKQLTVKKEKKRGKETEIQTRLTSVFSLIF